MSKLDRYTARELRNALLEVFDEYEVDVAVGITADGVAIRSQDEAVDACNLGTVTPMPAPTLPPPSDPPVFPQPPRPWRPGPYPFPDPLNPQIID